MTSSAIKASPTSRHKHLSATKIFCHRHPVALSARYGAIMLLAKVFPSRPAKPKAGYHFFIFEL